MHGTLEAWWIPGCVLLALALAAGLCIWSRARRPIFCLQDSELAVVAAADAGSHADRLSRQHVARRRFVCGSSGQIHVPQTLAAAYMAWIDGAVHAERSRGKLRFEYERQLHWFMCMHALGLEPAYAVPPQQPGSKPPAWLDGLELYRAWQREAAADLIAVLASAGLMAVSSSPAEADEEASQRSPPPPAKLAQEQMLAWLASSLPAFEARLALDQAVTRADAAGLVAALEQLEEGDGARPCHALAASADAPLPAWPPSGVNCLHAAAAQGHASMAALLLDRGASVDAVDFAGFSALHKAAGSGSVSTAALLIARGAAIDPRTRQHELTPLHVAAKNGRFAVARLLLAKGASVSSTSRAGCTAHDECVSHSAADPCCGLDGDAPGREYGALAAYLERLRRMEPAPRATTARRAWELLVASELQDAVERGDAAALAALCECYAGHLDCRDVDGSTALLSAALAGHADMLAVLLRHGASVGVAGAYGETALHAAVRCGAADGVRLLLACGASTLVNVPNDAGATPLDLASRRDAAPGIGPSLEAAAASAAGLLAEDTARARDMLASAPTAAGLRAQQLRLECSRATPAAAATAQKPVVVRCRTSHSKQPISCGGAANSACAAWTVTERGGVKVFTET